MTIFDERPAPPVPPRRLSVLVLPVLAALLGTAVFLSHRTAALHTVLREFRSETPKEQAPNWAMSDALAIRSRLLLSPRVPPSAVQVTELIRMVNSPVNELSQSEALDVLSLSQRTASLSAAQQQSAQEATLRVLRGSPGPMVRLESARLLGRLQTPGSAPALRALSGDPDPKVRQAAGEAMGQVLE